MFHCLCFSLYCFKPTLHVDSDAMFYFWRLTLVRPTLFRALLAAAVSTSKVRYTLELFGNSWDSRVSALPKVCETFLQSCSCRASVF